MDTTLVKQPSAIYRWLVLILISLAMFGNYYIYDSISPLADLLTKQLKFSDSEIGLLNAIYSWLVLILISLAMFGNYYIYDSISPLADLLTKQLKFSDSEIGLLNAIYS